MILGMSLETFTVLHTIISLVAIAAGLMSFWWHVRLARLTRMRTRSDSLAANGRLDLLAAPIR